VALAAAVSRELSARLQSTFGGKRHHEDEDGDVSPASDSDCTRSPQPPSRLPRSLSAPRAEKVRAVLSACRAAVRDETDGAQFIVLPVSPPARVGSASPRQRRLQQPAGDLFASGDGGMATAAPQRVPSEASYLDSDAADGTQSSAANGVPEDCAFMLAGCSRPVELDQAELNVRGFAACYRRTRPHAPSRLACAQSRIEELNGCADLLQDEAVGAVAVDRLLRESNKWVAANENLHAAVEGTWLVPIVSTLSECIVEDGPLADAASQVLLNLARTMGSNWMFVHATAQILRYMLDIAIQQVRCGAGAGGRGGPRPRPRAQGVPDSHAPAVARVRDFLARSFRAHDYTPVVLDCLSSYVGLTFRDAPLEASQVTHPGVVETAKVRGGCFALAADRLWRLTRLRRSSALVALSS
jgi:hypothetical protein